MKKSVLTSVLLWALLFMPALVLYAVPAFPDPVTFSQPNGDTLTVIMKGDEKIHWCESLDGYTLFRNQEGFLTYAQLDENGNLQASAYIATNIEQRDMATSLFLNSIEKNLFFSEIQQQLLLQFWQQQEDFFLQNESRNGKEVLGHWKGIVALIEFPDKKYKFTKEDFENLFNQTGYYVPDSNIYGSIRDYYREVSYNQFDISFKLFGIYEAPKSLAYYSGYGNVIELVKWVVNEKIFKESGIDFRDYDANGDGEVDVFHVLFAGIGAEAGAQNAIWSHSGQLSIPVVNNGIELKSYSCSPELRNTTQKTSIGVICHEMTHVLGAMDYYDRDYSGSGGEYPATGKWDLMALGCENGNGRRPAHPNMFVKIQFGWVTPKVFNSSGYVSGMPNSAENPVAYRINTKTTDEYYLLENRQKVGFDGVIPGNGLIIYHVHKNVWASGHCSNCAHPQRMYIVSANCQFQLPNATPSSYGNVNSASCPFPNNEKTSFTDDSTPAMWSWALEPTEKPLTNIIHHDQLISFDFMGGGDVNLGIESEETPHASLQLIPNPANNYVELRITNYELQIENVEVFDIYGRRLMTFDFRLSTNKIDISHLPAGLYFVRAGNLIAKLIVQ